MDTKERIKCFYEQVGTGERVGEFPDYIAEHCTVRVGETCIPVGIDGMRQHAMHVRGTYPDLKMTVIRQYRDGEYIISEFIAEGTHKGEWLGMKPTGKKLTFTGVNIDRVVDGKIAEHSGSMNTFETLYRENIIGPV